MTDILPIASYVIAKSDCSITNLKLNKLLYYIYGVNLVINAKDEISEGPEAWTYPGLMARFSLRSITNTRNMGKG